MKQKMKQSVLIAALLALGLAGCQKKEEAPAPEVMEAPAPLAPIEPMPEAPAPEAESMSPAPGDMPSTPPSQ